MYLAIALFLTLYKLSRLTVGMLWSCQLKIKLFKSSFPPYIYETRLVVFTIIIVFFLKKADWKRRKFNLDWNPNYVQNMTVQCHFKIKTRLILSHSFVSIIRCLWNNLKQFGLYKLPYTGIKHSILLKVCTFFPNPIVLKSIVQYIVS